MIQTSCCCGLSHRESFIETKQVIAPKPAARETLTTESAS